MAAPPNQTTNWKLSLAYDGSAFHGWQVQPGLATIQGTLSDCLLRVTGETVFPQGSGRTDAGVHALAQVSSFALTTPLPAANLHRALNRILPAAIRVLCCEEVPPSFHARHSVRGKTYEYRIFERRPDRRDPAPELRIHSTPGEPARIPEERICSPFLAPFVWDCRWPLSFDAMQQAAQLLLGTHDFTSMAASDPDKSQRDSGEHSSDPRPTKLNPIKTITLAEWSRVSTGNSTSPDPCSLIPDPCSLFPVPSLTFRISGTGFLHHMVRNIVGTLVEIGRGSLDPSDLTRILAARNRTAAGPTAPARGLFLAEVLYDSSSTDQLATDQAGCPTSRGDVGADRSGFPIHEDELILNRVNNLDSTTAEVTR